MASVHGVLFLIELELSQQLCRRVIRSSSVLEDEITGSVHGILVHTVKPV